MSTELVGAPLTMQAARVLTDEVKADTAALWTKLLRLYEGDAHTALGFASWGEYWEAEFDQDRTRGYQILKAAEVHSVLSASGKFSTRALPPTDSVARVMAPLLKQQPSEIPEVWGEVVEEHGPKPTAKQVKEIVARHVEPERSDPEPEYTCCPTCGHRLRADQPLRPRKEH